MSRPACELGSSGHEGDEEDLRALLLEKELLLKELHHRVKNNLQIISSLISMQMRDLADASARDALEECRTRVLAIALVHEQLGQSTSHAHVPLSVYIAELANNIVRAVARSTSQVTLDLAIEPISLAVEKAIPCGLLLNELITNAVKHAFPDGRAGVIRVELYSREGRVHLVFSDDGVGVPVDLGAERPPSLGARLIRTLAEQLEATIEITQERGTRVQLAFAASHS
jgi:two-component sensor histidine kinase